MIYNYICSDCALYLNKISLLCNYVVIFCSTGVFSYQISQMYFLKNSANASASKFFIPLTTTVARKVEVS